MVFSGCVLGEVKKKILTHYLARYFIAGETLAFFNTLFQF